MDASHFHGALWFKSPFHALFPFILTMPAFPFIGFYMGAAG